MGENKRTKIMDECPEGFEDDLKDFIDEIEGVLTTIRDTMVITGLEELSNIETAYDLVDELADSLY
jgi:hypothetical protein